MMDSDHRNERPEDNRNTPSERDGRMDREPTASWDDRPTAGIPYPPESAGQDNVNRTYERNEWSHSSQPPATGGNDGNGGFGGGQPPSWNQNSPRRPEDDHQRQRRTRRIVGMAAVFLALAILLTAGTAAVIYSITGRGANATTAVTTTTVASSTVNNTQGGTQSTVRPAASGVTSNTNKHFSIVEASSRQDPNRQALSIVEIAKRNKPAVVAINTAARIQNQFGQTGLVDAAGSGFIITADGYVVTNNHVVEGAQTISVNLDDGRVFPATIVGTDPRNDLAVLKVNQTGLPTVKLGESKGLEVGELAVAIGNPLGELSGTVTAGIISATDRTVTIENQSLVLLQTDAAINSGNSGGALIDSFGDVIGINTAKNAGAGVEGLGFAIPIDIAKPIIESLIQNGYVAGRPKLGIGTRDITAQMAQYYNMREGIYVRAVEAGSAAAQAGIAVGDIIIKADGKETLTTDALNAIKESKKVGDTMKITYVREGREVTVDVVLKEDVPDNMRQTSSNRG